MMLQAAIGKLFAAWQGKGLIIFSQPLDGFNVEADAILQAAKFGLLSGDDPMTLNLDALKLYVTSEMR